MKRFHGRLKSLQHRVAKVMRWVVRPSSPLKTLSAPEDRAVSLGTDLQLPSSGPWYQHNTA